MENKIVIDPEVVLNITANVVNKLKELDLKSTDFETVFSDSEALALAICTENGTLVEAAFSYLNSGLGFKHNPNNTIEKWRELRKWTLDQII